MAKYKLTDSGVQDTETGAFIPNAPGNRHWQEYLTWAQDNTADAQYTTQEIEDNAWADLRSERNGLLTETDFFMTTDFYNDNLTSQEQSDLATYRQALRDLPENTSDPTDVTWPSKPQIVTDYGI